MKPTMELAKYDGGFTKVHYRCFENEVFTLLRNATEYNEKYFVIEQVDDDLKCIRRSDYVPEVVPEAKSLIAGPELKPEVAQGPIDRNAAVERLEERLKSTRENLEKTRRVDWLKGWRK